MTDPPIRPVAVCVCRKDGRLLVEQGRDRVTGERFLRAIGGAIEFGERAADAVRREWREELGVDLLDLRLLGVLENLFTWEGRPGHEIVFVFDGRIEEPERFSERPLDVIDGGGQRHAVAWVAIEALGAGGTPLYPARLLELLRDAPG